MKLSDAIATGRVLINFDSRRWMDPDGTCGCAIGLAAAAIGKRITTLEEVYGDFPILGKSVPMPREAIKERDYGIWRVGDRIEVWYAISRMADNVYEGKLSLDQLIDWVRNVEPAEPAPAAAEQQAEAELLEHRATAEIAAIATGNRGGA